ncbi:MAG TPA: pyridoxal phosphate-dependent aminotransferase [Terriglobales bacterium]
MFAERTAWELKKNRYTEELERARAAGARLLDLTVSNPTACGFHFRSDHILRALKNPDALIYYPEPRGLLGARQAVGAYYLEHARRINLNRQIAPEQIFLTTGTSEAYSFLFRLLCNPGDQVLVPRPSYPLFDFLADIQDVKLAAYPLQYDHGWQIDFSVLESLITNKTRAVMVVHPNNPTGSFASRAEMSRLAQVCAEHDLALIADEVFLDYGMSDAIPASFAFNSDCLTFVLSGLSKISCLPQMKVGWMVVSGPAGLRSGAEERLEVIADTYLSMNAPLQLALPVLFEERRHIQPQLFERIEQNLRSLDEEIGQQKLVSRLQIQGGWYAVLRVPATRPDEELAIELIRGHGVVVHPGHFFDFPREGYLVVSLITREDQFREGIRRALQFQNAEC